MEEWQKQHIKNNIVRLIKATTCSAELLVQFEERKILSQADVESLELQHLTQFEKAKKLYEILLTRVGSYDALLHSLETTVQSGALQILKKYNTAYQNYGSISVDENRLLGTGSFGTKVYKGTFGGRDIAVKVINTDLNELEIAEKEIEFLKALDEHENIVRYFTAEKRDKIILIALELCHISLQDEVKLNIVNVTPVIILKKCTEGLVHLHKNNVIHRDLKPANVLLTKNGQVKISDFGLSKKIPIGMSCVHSDTVGTLDWMAPELLTCIEDEGTIKKAKQSKSADVFSLGCVFYYVLTKGSHPFGDKLVTRQANIYLGKIEITQEAVNETYLHLIKKMIAHSSNERPSGEEILETFYAQDANSVSTRREQQQQSPSVTAAPQSLSASAAPQSPLASAPRQSQMNDCDSSMSHHYKLAPPEHTSGTRGKLPPENKPSLLLSSDENRIIFEILGRGRQTLATAVGSLLVPTPDKQGWQVKDSRGAVCLVRDTTKKSYFIQVFSLPSKNLILRQKICNPFEYQMTLSTFMTFEGDSSKVAILFADTTEASNFQAALNEKLEARRQRINERKAGKSRVLEEEVNIVPPTRSKYPPPPRVPPPLPRVSPPGVPPPIPPRKVTSKGMPAEGFDLNLEDKYLRVFLEKAGVSANQLNDENTRKYIYNFIEEHGVIDLVKKSTNCKTENSAVCVPTPTTSQTFQISTDDTCSTATTNKLENLNSEEPEDHGISIVDKCMII